MNRIWFLLIPLGLLAPHMLTRRREPVTAVPVAVEPLMGWGGGIPREAPPDETSGPRPILETVLERLREASESRSRFPMPNPYHWFLQSGIGR